MNPHYHDTTNELANLDKYESKAEKQEDVILRFMRSQKSGVSPEDVHKAVFADDTPLTSVRRAMTNLTRDGLIIKTDKKKDGIYGRPVGTWIAPMKPTQLGLWESIESEFEES